MAGTLHPEETSLHNNLNSVAEFQCKWQSKFNPFRFHVMHMSLARSPAYSNYQLCQQGLSVVRSNAYLSVHLQYDLNCSTIVGYATSVACGMLCVDAKHNICAEYICTIFYHKQKTHKISQERTRRTVVMFL